jgi:hypothetical protein
MSLPALPPTTSTAARLRLGDAARLRRYRQYQDFYEGRHFARPRNGRSNLVVNYARAIVDKGVAYLLGRGLGFSVVPRREGVRLDARRAERAEQLLYDVYWDNDLDATDLQVAQNAGVLGDGVYKVFWDPDDGQVRCLGVDPYTFFAAWAPDDPSVLVRAETAYAVGGDEVVERWTTETFELLRGDRLERSGPNPYGWVPFVHVPNLQPPNQFWGVSDLQDVIAINRELDERLSDQADVIRYHADPPTVFKGVTDHSDLAVGPGTVWDIPADATVELLEWKGQPPAVQEHIQRIKQALYEISETPQTAFGDSGRLLSGVALETELRPIVQKTFRRRVFWTRALRARNRMILRLAEQYGVGGARPGEYAPYRSRVIWPPMLPRDDQLEVRNQIGLVGAGLRSHRTAMDALGTESPEEELGRILEDRATLGEGAETASAAASRSAEEPADSGADSVTGVG